MHTIVLALAAGMVFAFFLVRDMSGDIDNIVWRLDLTKAHLKHELAMPYFTPGQCGGFHLAADAQDFLFTIYMAVSFLVPNTHLSAKLANVLLALILIGGIYKWLEIFGITNRPVRIFGGLLGVITGYWMSHVTMGGHLWIHGFAYTPWILWLIEYFLRTKPGWQRPYALRVFALTGLLFLLINSGYYWLQVAFPLIVLRMVVFGFECLRTEQRGDGLRKVLVIALAGLGGILLSLARLGGIYEFQIEKFPRLGGAVGHMQVIGDTMTLLKAYWVSFFDPAVVTTSPFEGMLGPVWEHNNYFGTIAVVPLVLGLLNIKKLAKNKAFGALVLASFLQIALTRTTYVADFERMLFPILKQISWYWRGSGILVLLLIVLITLGLEYMIGKWKKAGLWLALLIMIGLCADIARVYQIKFSWPAGALNIFAQPPQPADPLINQYGLCSLGNLFGYGNDHPSQISVSRGSALDAPQRGGADYYNVHDVRVLAGPRADGGYFLQHDWPLLPRTDKNVFERFINYQQVVDLPVYLRVFNWLCLAAWLIYLGWGIWIARFWD